MRRVREIRDQWWETPADVRGLMLILILVAFVLGGILCKS